LVSGSALLNGQIKIWDTNGGNQSNKKFKAGATVNALAVLSNRFLVSGMSFINDQIKI
jgi:hypothetical protein